MEIKGETQMISKQLQYKTLVQDVAKCELCDAFKIKKRNNYESGIDS